MFPDGDSARFECQACKWRPIICQLTFGATLARCSRYLTGVSLEACRSIVSHVSPLKLARQATPRNSAPPMPARHPRCKEALLATAVPETRINGRLNLEKPRNVAGVWTERWLKRMGHQTSSHPQISKACKKWQAKHAELYKGKGAEGHRRKGLAFAMPLQRHSHHQNTRRT